MSDRRARALPSRIVFIRLFTSATRLQTTDPSIYVRNTPAVSLGGGDVQYTDQLTRSESSTPREGIHEGHCRDKKGLSDHGVDGPRKELKTRCHVSLSAGIGGVISAF